MAGTNKVTFRDRANSLTSVESKPVIIVDEEGEETKEEHTVRNMTLLPPDAIRWMNKRRPLNQIISNPTHIPPHQATQLREMFDGLDFDGGGEIDMKEFKDAISYVAEHSSVGTVPLLGDPKNVKAIFKAMDADGNGTVDFDEFVLAMTADNTNSTGDLSKLRSTFYDFANVHRRQNMLEVIKDKNSSDSAKFREFERLFQVEYFHNEDIELSVEEQVASTTKEVMKEKKKLGKLYWEKRHQEILRSRAANCYCNAERQRLAKYQKPGQKFEIPDINKLSKHHGRRKHFSKRMENIPIVKSSFLPVISSSQQKQLHISHTLDTLKKSRSIDQQLLKPPPVSVKKEWDDKARTYAETGEF